MAIKNFKPMTNGTRGMSKLVNEEILLLLQKSH